MSIFSLSIAVKKKGEILKKTKNFKNKKTFWMNEPENFLHFKKTCLDELTEQKQQEHQKEQNKKKHFSITVGGVNKHLFKTSSKNYTLLSLMRVS